MKPTRENQKIRVRKHLRKHGSLTMMGGIWYLNVHRLAARIMELRKEGMKIKTVIQSDKTAKYVLVK